MNLAQLPTRPDYVEAVYDTLLAAITDGRLAPGTRIKQEALAEQLKVSRSPVLLALRLLKKDGLLSESGGRGLVVTPIDPVQIRQLYQVRGAIDTLAARLAAERHATLPEALLQQGRQALDSQDVNAMIDADMAFHNALYEASENSFVIGSARLHWIHVRRAQGSLLQYRSDWSAICDEHEQIARAIREGQVALASRLSEHHTELAHRGIATNLVGTEPIPANTRAPRDRMAAPW